MPERVSIGQILLLRNAFERVAVNPDKRDVVRKHAGDLMQLLDEILERREKEATNG
jgi:hypothetical protein